MEISTTRQGDRGRAEGGAPGTPSARANRSGFTMIEVAVGAAMLAVLLTIIGQMLVAMRQNTRRAEERALVLQSVDNALEAFVAQPWGRIDEGSIASVQLSDMVRRRWPHAKLTGKVAASNDPVEAKRVTLTLSLGPEAPLRPVSLTTWAYRAGEK